MLDRVPTAVANGATIGGVIRIQNGFVLARAVHAVLHGEKLGEAEHQCSATLLLASGVQVQTGRIFSEVAAEVEAANDEARYMKQAMEHILGRGGGSRVAIAARSAPGPDRRRCGRRGELIGCERKVAP